MSDRDTSDRAIETGDAVADEILSGLDPFRFGEAADPAALSECFRLRYRAVPEFDPAAAGRFSSEEERDEFDSHAIQIIGRDGATPIATCRIVLPVAGQLLPMERAFGLALSLTSPMVEWGRVVVDPAYRGDGHSIFMGLAAQGWRTMRERGYTTAVGATPPRLVALFEALGFAVTSLGLARSYWGEPRVPILCEARPSVRGLNARRRGDPGDDPPDGDREP
jgi:N-acyl-L-homoserine lactone synthetase